MARNDTEEQVLEIPKPKHRETPERCSPFAAPGQSSLCSMSFSVGSQALGEGDCSANSPASGRAIIRGWGRRIRSRAYGPRSGCSMGRWAIHGSVFRSTHSHGLLLTRIQGYQVTQRAAGRRSSLYMSGCVCRATTWRSWIKAVVLVLGVCNVHIIHSSPRAGHCILSKSRNPPSASSWLWP